ncbi:putative endonuclease [Natronospira proteinivora]|uniref:UPF0102 protein J2T60_000059 n=1 Tax=Natronospira proteinivora TaxID=1807133 RepID=A0ABT1G465_9GAMM|nr:YraN family protein [Natronospira proteinivora]MCP1726094.1 putative endonuclease [Natronospira proteinivora]
MSRSRGHSAEERARIWLQDKGLITLASNLHLAGAELDLVMLDGETVAFVEVRHRENDSHGDGLESVGPRKRRHLARAAEAYLAGLPVERDGRFDVLALAGPLDNPRIEWLKDAFDLDDL